jgi:hypothetical protein
VNQIAALPPGLRLYTLALLLISAAGCWLFVVLYHRAYRWWTNEFGRHLVAFSACLGLFLTYYVVLAFWPEMPYWLRLWLRTGLFTLLTGVIVWRLVLFGRVAVATQKRSD